MNLFMPSLRTLNH